MGQHALERITRESWPCSSFTEHEHLQQGTANPRELMLRHQNRQRCLVLCSRVLQLIGHLQHHRGATLAVLAGDIFFEPRLVRLQAVIRRQLDELLVEDTLLNQRVFLALYREWLTISRQWRQDKPLTNYELHSHLIEQLVRTLWQVARSPESHGYHKAFPLVQFVFHDLTRLKERVGQLRGLVCHSLYISGPVRRLNARIHYSLTETRTCLEKIRDVMTGFADLDAEQKALFDPLITILAGKNLVPRLQAVLAQVQELCRGRFSQEDVAQQVDPVGYFSLMTRIMSGLGDALQQGIYQLEYYPEPDLRAWIDGGSISHSHSGC